jgi:ubiquinone biosynthesis protein
VKVRRPGIANSVNRDLDVLDELATMVEQRTTWGAEYRVSDLGDEFAEHLREELDFEIEARNASDIAANLAGDGIDVLIPAVYHDLTTRRVLVMEWLDGVSVRETHEIDDLGVDRRELAEDLLRTMLQQMLVDAQYHADPHPGNVMVLHDGRLALIDFGAASRIDPLQQTAIREVMIGVSQRDLDLLRQAVLQVATLRRDVDHEDLERALSRFMTRHLAPGMVPSAAMFNDLLQLFFTFGINLPPEMSTFRALITLEGTLTTLSPGYPVIDRAEAIAGEWMRARLAPSSLEARRRRSGRDRRNADQRARWSAVRGSDVAVRVLRVFRSVL